MLAVPPHLLQRQVTASDPARSIWVSANAGSGKTHVLTQRVIRLLLRGVAPSKILCLTFTKAAAAEMSARVFKELARWTDHDDSELRAAIVATGAPAPDAADLLLARRLFTRTVETPGGLKIQTIHAFCERLLHLFPFEANVPARFEVADDKRAQEMLSLAKRAAIASAQRDGGEVAVALALVADLAGAAGLDKLLGAAMKLRKTARRATADPQRGLAVRLGAGNLAGVDAVQRAMIDQGIAPARWAEIAAVFAVGSARDMERAVRLRNSAALLAANSPPLNVLDDYIAVFFDSKGLPRTSLMTKKLAAAHPGLSADLMAEQARLSGLREKLKVAETIERSDALVAVTDAIMEQYDHAKNAGGVLDFDDLIARALALLEHSDAGWVLHKLDAGIDHVLVDEAQDTSETQWDILERLTGDFASGAGARAHPRSFFVVGDDKQSIFSFQGAAPLMFDEMRTRFENRFRAGRIPFERVSLNASFRSVPGILAAVDTLFGMDTHQDGLVAALDVWPVHESLKTSLPSLVEIWQPLPAPAMADPEDWTIPVDLIGDHSPASIVADRVARRIKQMIAPHSEDFVHEGRGTERRRVRPGDILILVRTRNAFFEAVIRALKTNHVPVAGADRLDVANHIAVMDLVAAGRAALLPQDDLSVACVLKSPLFGLTDDDLIALAPRREAALIEVLAASAVPRYREASDILARLAARAQGATPFSFYVELLGRDSGRLKMETRLGPEAHDAIDEFLRLALAHEAQGAPSLASFLADVEALDSSIKRDMEGPGDAVRVMTVHAAKGLEAKVVFMPDTCAVPDARLDATVFDLDAGTGKPPLLVWSPHKADDPEEVARSREAERKAKMNEYRRLLYVALTRAEERLYLAGFYNVRLPPDDCWGQMIDRAFREAETAPAPWDANETVLRIVQPGSAGPGDTLGLPCATGEQGALSCGPPWLFQPIARLAAESTALRPSRRAIAPTAERRAALAYGDMLHLLLQHLPSQPVAQRAEKARAFLAARPGSLPQSRHEALIAEALAVIALPELAPLFSGEARAEVAVVGRLPRPDGTHYEVSGKVDRLVVLPDRVIAADFKSGEPKPDVPDDYRRQIALYRKVLAPLWPGKRLAMLLVWTRTPSVVELRD